MRDTPLIGFVPIARPTFDVPLAQEKTQQVRSRLVENGFSLVGPDALVMTSADVESALSVLGEQPVDLLLILQATFADSTMVLEIAQRLGLPLALWALPEARVGGRLRLNSFCGINLAAHGLTRAGISYDYLYAEPDDQHALLKLDTIARAANVRRRLENTRIGRVGENPAGFDTCRFDAQALRETLGVEVVQLQLEDVFAGVRAVSQEPVAVMRGELNSRLTGLDQLDTESTDKTLGTYVTLRDLAAAQQLDGYAVRCWPEFFTDLGCSACGAMSMLSDTQTPCSCEADVNGTITQLILQWLSGAPAFGSDLVSFDVEQDVAVLWHCGLAPLSMADPDYQPEAAIHSNRQMPLLMQFPLKAGRVTLARLSEATGTYRLVVGAGEMLKAPPAFTGTSGTIRFESGAECVMNMMMEEGLEHHISLTYGDYVAELIALAQMLDIPVLRL